MQAKLTSYQNVEILLYCAGTPLNDEILVSDLPCHTLELTIPLLGGKVHGSLARAGKVKGQTPKVRHFFLQDLQFKKKIKTYFKSKNF